MDFRKILDPIWDLVLKRVSKFVILEFRDALLVPKITKCGDLLYMDVPYGQMPIKILNMVKIHGFTWAIILKSMVLDHKIFCLVFYVLKKL